MGSANCDDDITIREGGSLVILNEQDAICESDESSPEPIKNSLFLLSSGLMRIKFLTCRHIQVLSCDFTKQFTLDIFL